MKNARPATKPSAPHDSNYTTRNPNKSPTKQRLIDAASAAGWMFAGAVGPGIVLALLVVTCGGGA